MNQTAVPSTTLQKRVLEERFLNAVSDKDLLDLIRGDFAPELERLKRAYANRGQDSDHSPTTPSPSRLLFGKEYDEVNRTLVGLLSLRWTWVQDYNMIAGDAQAQDDRLSLSSFKWLGNFLKLNFSSPENMYSLITAVLINDLGKDPQLADDVLGHIHEDVKALNHDMILYHASLAGLVPCLDRLSRQHKADVEEGIRLGAVLNFGQLAQAENAPASLSILVPAQKRQELEQKAEVRALRLRFAEQVLDVAGAEGHMDWTCAMALGEPVLEGYRAALDASVGLVEERYKTLREAYDTVLVRRCRALLPGSVAVGEREQKEKGCAEDEYRGHDKGWRPKDGGLLDVTKPKDRALMRLLCMGRVADGETAMLYEDAFTKIDKEVQGSLTLSLNQDGSIQEPAVQPTYMPALLARAVKGTPTAEARPAVLESALRFLSRVMSAPPGESLGKRKVTVIERSCRHALERVSSAANAHVKKEHILDTEPVPEDVVAVEEA